MIRRAERIGGIVAGRVECLVIVDHLRLIGVDVPFGDAGHLRRQRRRRQRMIEVAKQTIKGVRIGAITQELVDQIGVAASLERRDRIFFGIGVEVAND